MEQAMNDIPTPPTPPSSTPSPSSPSPQPPALSACQPVAPQQVQVCLTQKSPSLLGRLVRSMAWWLLICSLVLNVCLLVSTAKVSKEGLASEVLQRGQADQIVAVYIVRGIIDSDAVKKFTEFYRYAGREPKVKAIVLRVESPGGGVGASEEIHHMVETLKNTGRPIVVSMGAVAASGGYMISAPADEIFAENSTITGSIGVIAQVPNLQGTMKKIGAEMITFKSTNADRWKDMLSPWKPVKPLQRQRMTVLLDELQNQFEQIVKTGRGEKLKIRKVKYHETLGSGPEARRVAKTELIPFNGKAYLAGEAKALGLIDEIGFLEDAYRRAGELAGLSEPSVRRYKPKGSVMSQLFGQQSASVNIDLSLNALDKLQSPRLLVLWTGD